MIGGQHLRVEGRYLDAYGTHAAWLEDHRDESNGCLADLLIGGALAVPVSRSWEGYLILRNTKPKPFVWTKSAEGILKRERRALDALDDIRENR